MSDEKNMGDPKLLGKMVAHNIAFDCELIGSNEALETSVRNALNSASMTIRSLLAEIEAMRPVSNSKIDPHEFGCHCDLEPGMAPDGCVIDQGRRDDCIHAKRVERKEHCGYWQPIQIVKAK